MKEFFKVTNLKQVMKYADDFSPVETEEIDWHETFEVLSQKGREITQSTTCHFESTRALWRTKKSFQRSMWNIRFLPAVDLPAIARNSGT